jgi:hypothetical protein
VCDAGDEHVWEYVRASGETLWATLRDDACGPDLGTELTWVEGLSVVGSSARNRFATGCGHSATGELSHGAPRRGVVSVTPEVAHDR